MVDERRDQCERCDRQQQVQALCSSDPLAAAKNRVLLPARSPWRRRRRRWRRRDGQRRQSGLVGAVGGGHAGRSCRCRGWSALAVSGRASGERGLRRHILTGKCRGLLCPRRRLQRGCRCGLRDGRWLPELTTTILPLSRRHRVGVPRPIAVMHTGGVSLTAQIDLLRGAVDAAREAIVVDGGARRPRRGRRRGRQLGCPLLHGRPARLPRAGAGAPSWRSPTPMDSVTVSEVVLLPGDGSLLAPPWVPWCERIAAGDLQPGDQLAAEPDDPRLVPNQVDSGDLEELDTELGLGRRRAETRRDAARPRSAGTTVSSGRSQRWRKPPSTTARRAGSTQLSGALRVAFRGVRQQVRRRRPRRVRRVRLRRPLRHRAATAGVHTAVRPVRRRGARGVRHGGLTVTDPTRSASRRGVLPSWMRGTGRRRGSSRTARRGRPRRRRVPRPAVHRAGRQCRRRGRRCRRCRAISRCGATPTVRCTSQTPGTADRRRGGVAAGVACLGERARRRDGRTVRRGLRRRGPGRRPGGGSDPPRRHWSSTARRPRTQSSRPESCRRTNRCRSCDSRGSPTRRPRRSSTPRSCWCRAPGSTLTICWKASPSRSATACWNFLR